MLKIINVPDESTFAEADLKPGLRVIRKSDGAEYSLNLWRPNLGGSKKFSLCSNGIILEHGDGYCLAPYGLMLDWLNRDFRRVEDAKPQYKTVGEVPDRVVFDYENCCLVFPTNYISSNLRRCVGLETGSSLTVPIDRLVTRVYGPIHIDPSVMEGK